MTEQTRAIWDAYCEEIRCRDPLGNEQRGDRDMRPEALSTALRVASLYCQHDRRILMMFAEELETAHD